MLASYKTLRRIYGLVMILLVCFVIAWIHGFIWYLNQIPSAVQDTSMTTDAAVVLTGGTKRIKEGLVLLDKGLAKTVFISGVNKNISISELYKLVGIPQKQKCCVELGYEASTTRDNRLEVEEWLKRNQIKSLRLVTSNYHMPRALYIFRHLNQDYTLIPHPVFPDNFEVKNLWYWPNYAVLSVVEYNKYLMTRADDYLIELP